MGEGTVFMILACFFVYVTLAVLGFVARGVVELLDFVMSKSTIRVVTVTFGTLHMAVRHFARVASSIAIIVVVMATG